MDAQTVLETFAMMAGLTSTEAAEWTLLCNKSISEIEYLIKPDVDLTDTDINSRLNSVAAALSFYRYVCYRVSGNGTDSFTAGEIQIKGMDKKIGIETARSILNEAKMSVTDLLIDNNFAFKEINNL